MSEFSLIDRYFSGATGQRADVVLGIGDDAAIVQPPAGQQLVMATDTLVAGVHFPLGTSPDSIGHKALAVNLSDLAAMGATPAWALLALTLPAEDPQWLTGFMAGFSALAARFDLALVGGDTTRGPLTITVQVIGYLPAGTALTRAGATPGDRIMVTGKFGDAALALRILAMNDCERTECFARLRVRLDRPDPRVAAGLALRSLATSAIDISDGLVADLQHLLTASGAGARLVRDQIPRSLDLVNCLQEANIDPKIGWQAALVGGDDYELCFTLPAARVSEALSKDWSSCGGITEIGTVTPGQGIELVDTAGEQLLLADYAESGGYDHFI